ncbi:54S ribosomal protein L28, mitochondrial [Candida viswanathii]|uniref:Large ribosomal subunit protein mL40 n=1 Tax=Candida viswanathii TaxID=5486 RepID=A0A367YB22_9ASCO|nr:54S ribosomal protein L28, mitochondrial [Candida viswanathii]
MFNPFKKSTFGISTLKTFTRGAKVKTGVNDATQKVVNQLSVLSASRKQPKLLRLCNEDIVKHKTIMNAWKLVNRRRVTKRMDQLTKQYESIKNAMDDLKATSPALFKAANTHDEKRFDKFPIEMRIPTDYPPTKPWIYHFVPGSIVRK